MAETEPGSQPPVERRRTADATSAALAGSVPDDNQYLMRMVKLLLGTPRFGLITTSLAGLIMLVYVVAKWGVPAMLAMQTLILQLHEDQTTLAAADREIQKQQVNATQDVLSALQGLSGKMDLQGRKIDEQAGRIEELAADVGVLKREQTESSRKMSAIAAEQRRLKASTAPPHAP